MADADQDTTEFIHRVPLRTRSQKSRSRILHEARLMFAERGFGAANVRDIAAAAETRHSMIRYHFGSKEQLWREAVRDMFDLLDRAVDPRDILSDGYTGVEAFKEFLRRYIRHCAANPEHARIMISEAMQGGERLDWIVATFLKPRHQLLEQNFDVNGRLPGMPDMTPLSFIYIVSSVCQMPFVLAHEAKALFGVYPQQQDIIDSHIQSVLNLFFQYRDQD